ncbi:ADP-ribosyltransferase [Pseudomonas sp. p1(2021b)]|uniref:ADP-ribosyltransferase n=1 Tax=Pseudomonas sp. p1(2021b) TaxID=2874628 RepID=UPI001CCF97A7|nr:ADP-ribosyltransferase [Pseudomonas sp. p1(2021b)]UBM26465.1 ADP-ribosyltransferase [Pseudomonas sp. p1(2021b)]
MLDLQHIVLHNLKVLGTGRALTQLTDDFLAHFPDPYRLAQRHARQILRRHTGKDWDPDLVWWHQFTDAASSSRSFTGWAHNQRPIKSLRFTELMIERFSVGFQDATDELDLYGGFYCQGAYAQRFDERNEVPMLAREVQKDFWKLDFAQVVQDEVEAFWRTRADDFRVLAKVSLLAQCKQAERDGRLTAQDARQIRALVSSVLASSAPIPTLELLRTVTEEGETTLSVYRPSVGRACLYILRPADGRVWLYMPYDEQALRGFASELAMARWLRSWAATTEGMQRLRSAAIADAHLGDGPEATEDALRQLADSSSDAAALQLLRQSSTAGSRKLFTQLQEDARSDMRRNAGLMVDNQQLRKAMLTGYLAAFIKVSALLVPLSPGISLALLAASVTKVWLDVDAATHARSRTARQDALRGAIIDSIFAALNMIELGFGASYATLAYRAAFHETGVSLADWQPLAEPQGWLQDQQANEILYGLPQGRQMLRGIHLGPKGESWIELQGLPYRVRYSTELNTWLIVPPDNPFAFAPIRPVRLNEAGEWELLGPPRLAGGAPGDGLAQQSSAFWDEYMLTDEQRSEFLSDTAMARQESLFEQLDIPELASDAEPLVDDEGFDYIDHHGASTYTYKHDGRFKNHLIDTYTMDDSINDYLRQGVRNFSYGDEASYLDKLADSLERLPADAEVPLYRGGCGERGTSGVHFRSGRFSEGDILVNTDLTSFTENPYIIRKFSADPDKLSSRGLEGVFDDTSVVFELPAGRYRSGRQIAPLSAHGYEVETLFLPGTYFQIDEVSEIVGVDYRFVKVRLRQVSKPQGGPVYDLRSGDPFDRGAYLERLGAPHLVERFFGP